MQPVQNKTDNCITLTEMQQRQTNETNSTIKSIVVNGVFKKCINMLRDNEGLTGGAPLHKVTYLCILKLIEPHFGCEINIGDYEYDCDCEFSRIEDELIELHKTELLQIVRVSNQLNEETDILSNQPTKKNIFLGINPSILEEYYNKYMHKG